MSGDWERQVRDFAEPRGWLIERTRGNHFSLAHPQVPRKLFISGTPSDRMTMLVLTTKVRRAERGAGVNQHLANTNARFAEPLAILEKGGKRLLTITCQTCGTFEQSRIFDGSDEHTSMANARNRFRELGWIAGRRRSDDRCPRCIGKPAAPPALTKQPSAIRVIATKDDLHRIEHAEWKAAAQVRRRIWRILERTYSPHADGYIAGESDETVAAKAKATPEAVREIREAHFGPAEPGSAISDFTADLAAFERRVDQIQSTMMDQLAGMETALQALLRKAAALQKEQPSPAPRIPQHAHMNGSSH